MVGWVKLHRKIKDWEWYSDPVVSRVFLHLLLTVNIEDSSYQGVNIPVGSRVCGYLRLSIETGLSVQNIRTSFRKLKATGDITVKPQAKFSVVAVVNWSEYQGANRQLTGNQQATNRQVTTSKEDNNKEVIYIYRGSNIEKEKLFEIFWSEYPDLGKDGKHSAAFKGTKETARKSFYKILKEGKEHEGLINACKRYKIFVEHNGERCCHASTWLNQSRWNTDYTVSAAANRAQGKHYGGNKPSGISEIVDAASAAKEEINRREETDREGKW